MIYPTIYKRTSTGKIQTWFAETDGGRFRSTAGQLNGKKTTTEWTICFPKNIGKSNATTAEQQAISEVEADYVKRLAKDYRKDLESIDADLRFKPMLAHEWEDRKHKIRSDFVYIQPKLDGIRCIMNKDGMWTREGKEIFGAPHIFEGLKSLFDNDPKLILDGELYNHDLRNDFNSIVSIVKKQDPTLEELELSKKLVQYWIYDMPSVQTIYKDRWSSIVSFFATHDCLLEYCIQVETSKIHYCDVVSYSKKYIEWEFEGSIIRLGDGVYENKRSDNLLKYKEFQDKEYEIVDILEGKGNKASWAAKIIFKLEDGTTSKAGVIGNEDYCKELLVNKHACIGKMGTINFQSYTPDGKPRFAKFKGVRFDVD